LIGGPVNHLQVYLNNIKIKRTNTGRKKGWDISKARKILDGG
jgi:hypothetical protein